MERGELEDSRDATEIRSTAEPHRRGEDAGLEGMDVTDFGDSQGDSIRDFFNGTGASCLEEHVNTILDHPELLTEDQLVNLHAILQHYLPEKVRYGADFDFGAEITAQITAVRAMRLKVMTPQGTLQEGITVREAKEVVGSCTTLLTTLMKHHPTIQNFERQRALEQATVRAIKTLPEDHQKLFYEEFERALGGAEQE